MWRRETGVGVGVFPARVCPAAEGEALCLVHWALASPFFWQPSPSSSEGPPRGYSNHMGMHLLSTLNSKGLSELFLWLWWLVLAVNLVGLNNCQEAMEHTSRVSGRALPQTAKSLGHWFSKWLDPLDVFAVCWHYLEVLKSRNQALVEEVSLYAFPCSCILPSPCPPTSCLVCMKSIPPPWCVTLINGSKHSWTELWETMC